MKTVEVVTRYGKKHLARGNKFIDAGRYFTLCMGTSAWSVGSWEDYPDHPLLTIEQIRNLEMDCEKCKMLAHTLS